MFCVCERFVWERMFVWKLLQSIKNKLKKRILCLKRQGVRLHSAKTINKWSNEHENQCRIAQGNGLHRCEISTYIGYNWISYINWKRQNKARLSWSGGLFGTVSVVYLLVCGVDMCMPVALPRRAFSLLSPTPPPAMPSASTKHSHHKVSL